MMRTNTVLGVMFCLHCSARQQETSWYTETLVLLALYGQCCGHNNTRLSACPGQGIKTRHLKEIVPFPALDRLSFSIKHCFLLLKTKSCNRHLIIFKNQYQKLTRSRLIRTVPSAIAKTILVDSWVILSGIPTDSLTDNGLQFVSMCFTDVNVRLGIKHLITAAHHPRPTG